jgi:lactate dehydrogenase-like 2-hydroxyacid dehydrogenase
MQRFMQRKADKKWEVEPMEIIAKKTMLICGYGDIGSNVGKIAKHGFGMKVIGLKRRPEELNDV